MGWSIGSDGNRNIGYGVPAVCDKPGCTAEINRGLSYVCGSEPYGGTYGCGLFFCGEHLYFKEFINKRTIQVPGEEKITVQVCDRCYKNKLPFEPKPDVAEWIIHKLTDETWQQWRDANPEEVERLRTALTVKILPMWQPYASLAVLGEKENETRSWKTPFRGIVAIYATKNFPPEAKSLFHSNPFCREALGRHSTEQFVFGAVIGSVELYDIRSTNDSDVISEISEQEKAFGIYTPNRFVWRLRNPVELQNPIPLKGQQGMWTAPDEIRDAILESRGIR